MRRLLAVELVDDINSIPSDAQASRLVAAGDRVFYYAQDRDAGQQLFVSGGAVGDAQVVKVIEPGGTVIENMVAVGSRVFFTASTLASGEELWVSDGTEAGTHQVVDLEAGGGSPGITNVIARSGKVYFIAGSQWDARHLYESDGTAAGTKPSAADAVVTQDGRLPFELAPWGTAGIAVRTYLPNGIDSRVYTSDGTAAGTRLVLGGPNWAGGDLRGTDDGAAFLSLSPVNAPEFTTYRIDPTSGVATAFTGARPQQTSDILTLGTATLFLKRTPSGDGTALYRVDASGQVTLVFDQWSPGTTANQFAWLGVVNGRAVLGVGIATSTGRFGSVWSTDGTVAGTKRLLSSMPAFMGGATAGTMTGAIGAVVAGRLYFPTADAGPRIISTDGISTRVESFVPRGTNSDAFTWLTAAGGKLFGVTPIGLGQDVLAYDVSTRATIDVKTRRDTQSSQPSMIRLYDGSGFAVLGHTGDGTSRLLILDGSGAVVRTLEIDSVPFMWGSIVETAGQNRFLIVGQQPGDASQTKLWSCDGVTGACVELMSWDANINSAFQLGYVGGFARTPSTTFFVRADRELWKTDGTLAGTQMVRAFSNLLSAGTSVDDRIYFVNQDLPIGPRLWTSDGTAAGTFGVQTSTDRAAADSILGPDGAGGVYFCAWTPELGSEIYRASAAPGSAALVLDVWPGPESGVVPFPAVDGAERRGALAGDQFFFQGNNGSSGFELFATGGTASTTRLVRDLYPGPNTSSILNLRSIGDAVVFQATGVAQPGADADYLLWRSDGTSSGTVPILVPNAPVSPALFFKNAVALGGTIYFSCGLPGPESRQVVIYRTDGTPGSVTKVAIIDTQHYYGVSTPGARMIATADCLLMVIDERLAGLEPYRITGADIAAPRLMNSTYRTADARVEIRLNERGVWSGIAGAGVTITRIAGVGETPSPSQFTYGVVSGQPVISFANLPNRSLPNGTFDITIARASVVDPGGNPMNRDVTVRVVVREGDVNGDGSVNFSDLQILASYFGQSGRGYAQGNLDRDPQGRVNFDDVLILARRYERTAPASLSLAPPQQAPSPPEVLTGAEASEDDDRDGNASLLA